MASESQRLTSKLVHRLFTQEDRRIIAAFVGLMKNEGYTMYISKSILISCKLFFRWFIPDDNAVESPLLKISDPVLFVGLGKFLEALCIAGTEEFRRRKAFLSTNRIHTACYTFRDRDYCMEVDEIQKAITICLFSKR